ncbi:hypothetical protein [Carboxylicivirga sp. M1479]|uniref:hypothetical protein n=1 Tax=Carboxylicivirga sp. M1479 TaxID=2594476 RepID=UPI001177AA7B|nr:hypothetical protein [Carboxylicivirga sp. M1479]TRX61667.1 hypothetical protein FNN09_20135 [Carboxylicivirga sp. M1479]
MKITISITVLLFCSILNAQDFQVPQSFSHLKKVSLLQYPNVFAFLHVDFINEFELSKEFEENNYLEEFIGIIKPNKNLKHEYLLSFTVAPSADDSFGFYKKTGNSYEYSFSISGKQIYIPGNGSIYVSGHTNNWFNEKKKFTFENDTIREIAQPLYHVGLKTKTRKAIALYSDKTESKKVAYLPKGANVEVIASENSDGQGYFLIKTSFGLLGWWQLDHYFEPSIEGLFYNGD